MKRNQNNTTRNTVPHNNDRGYFEPKVRIFEGQTQWLDGTVWRKVKCTSLKNRKRIDRANLFYLHKLLKLGEQSTILNIFDFMGYLLAKR